MNISLPTIRLKKYLANQLDNFFPDDYRFEGKDVDIAFNMALERTEFCFKYNSIYHYTHDNQVWFDHMHSDQYSTFIYFLANSLWKQSENKILCNKLVLLNKLLNSIFVSYKCNLPDIFYMDHPVGTVLGNAEYSNFLVVLQNVTVNTSHGNFESPKIGRGVFLSAGVSVIGNKSIGNYCSIGANTLLYNKEIPDNSVVFTDSQGKIGIKHNKKECYSQNVFNVKITEEIDGV